MSERRQHRAPTLENLSCFLGTQAVFFSESRNACFGWDWSRRSAKLDRFRNSRTKGLPFRATNAEAQMPQSGRSSASRHYLALPETPTPSGKGAGHGPPHVRGALATDSWTNPQDEARASIHGVCIPKTCRARSVPWRAVPTTRPAQGNRPNWDLGL